MRRRTAGRVDGEENAFREGMDENRPTGIDERKEPGRLERRGIGADRIGRAGGAVPGVLQVADEVVVLKWRDDEHRGIEDDAQPLHDRHDVTVQG